MSDPISAPPEFLSVDEAAALLRCHPKTVLRAVRERTLPGVLRVGRSIRIRRADLLAERPARRPAPCR